MISIISNTEKRVEIMTHISVFLRNFEVFGSVVQQCFEYLLFLINRNKTVKIYAYYHTIRL